MSVPDWAPYDDAIKMILRGPVFKHLAPTQNGLLHAMLTVGVRDEAGNRTEKRNLPGIRSKEYFKDEEETESATMYYIPDLFKLMVEICPPWLDGHTLPVDLEYLRNLTGELTSGKEEWALLCRKIEIEHELAELERTNHGGDPLKLESQTRMRTGLKEELLEISTKLQAPHLRKNTQSTSQLEVGSPGWHHENAKRAANALHDQPGGSRDKQQQIQEIWASGKYSTRDRCAEEECAALGMPFSTARRALINTPDP